MDNRREIIIVTGPRNSGKTTWCLENLEDVDGVLSVKVFENGKHIGYDALRPGKRTTVPLLRTDSNTMSTTMTEFRPTVRNRIGKFEIIEAGFIRAREWIDRSISDTSHDVVIDEVGQLELGGGGFATSLRSALESVRDRHVYITIRDLYMEAVCKEFNITDYRCIELVSISDL